MWTYEAVIIGAITLICFIIYAHFFSESPTQQKTLAGGKSLKKLTTAALNMDLIKSGYKTYKKIKK